MRAKVVTVMRWHAQDEVNQKDSEQNEVDGMKKGVDNYYNSDTIQLLTREEGSNLHGSLLDSDRPILRRFSIIAPTSCSAVLRRTQPQHAGRSFSNVWHAVNRQKQTRR